MSRRLVLAIGAALVFFMLAILEVFMVNADTVTQGGALR